MANAYTCRQTKEKLNKRHIHKHWTWRNNNHPKQQSILYLILFITVSLYISLFILCIWIIVISFIYLCVFVVWFLFIYIQLSLLWIFPQYFCFFLAFFDRRRILGLSFRDCAGSLNNLVLRSTNVNAIDVTAKAIYELFVFFPGPRWFAPFVTMPYAPTRPPLTQ